MARGFRLVARGEGDLKTRYRPQRLSEAVPSFPITRMKKILTDPNASRVFLFEGKSGTGKTSVARILARASVCVYEGEDEKPCLECDPCRTMEMLPDFFEINVANFRKIDDTRDTIAGMVYHPQILTKRIYIFDECFHGETLVQTASGQKPIAKIVRGDQVYALDGLGTVNHVFKNKVPLSRIIRLTLSNGERLFTTKDHLFYTNEGWQEAQDLLQEGLMLVSFCSKMMDSPHLFCEGLHDEDMRMVQGALFNQVQDATNMQQVMRAAPSNLYSRVRENRDQSLQRVWSEFCNQETKEQQETILQSVVCGEKQDAETRDQSGSTQRPSAKEDFTSTHEIACNTSRQGSTRVEQRPHEAYESCTSARCSRQGNRDEASERLVARLAREARRQRQADATAGCSCRSARLVTERQQLSVETRDRCLDQTEEPVSHELQNRCRQQGSEDRDRSRRQGSSHHEKAAPGQEERRSPYSVRVDSIEIYQRGCNDGAFEGVIGDQERSQGFVEFYDLEMSGHPSYFANGVCVHNCHQLTNDSQQLLLKVLEEPPEEVMIFLCTTERANLKKTLIDRCDTITFKGVSKPHVLKIFEQLKEDCGVDADPKIMADMHARCEGSIRALLNLVQQYVDGDYEIGADDELEVSDDIKDLAYALINGDWSKASRFLKQPNVKKKPESIRISVMCYLRALVLNHDTPRGSMDAAVPLGRLSGRSMFGDPVIDQYNELVLRCLRACYRKS